MHWKALIILGVVNVIYILIGGAIFHALESSNEDTTKTTINQDYAVFLSKYVFVLILVVSISLVHDNTIIYFLTTIIKVTWNNPW